MKKRITLLIIFFIIIRTQLVSLTSYKTHFEQGMEAFKSGNYGSSELLLRKITESDDMEFRDRAWYYLSLSIFHQKKYTSAIFEFNRFLTICSTEELCNLSQYWIAESYYLLNDYLKTIEEFKKYISRSKDPVYIANSYDRIGSVYFIQKRYDEAIIEWMKALSKTTDNVMNNQRRLYIGEAYFLNGNIDEAINLLRPLLKSNIESRQIAKAALIIGQAYQKKGLDQKALNAFSLISMDLIKDAPFYNAQYYRANSYLAINNIELAELHYKAFLDIGKDSRWYQDAKYSLGKLNYEFLNNEAKAVTLLEEVRKSSTDPKIKYKTLLLLGSIYFENDTLSAVSALEEAVKLEPIDDKKESYLLLGKAYLKSTRFSEAEKILEKYIEDYSYDKEIDSVYFMLARVYLDQDNFVKAIEGFDKVKEVNPFSKYINESYYYLAVANLKNNNTQNAIEQFNKYINQKEAEKKYDAYIQLLNIFLTTKDFKSSDSTVKIISRNYLKQNGVENVLLNYGKALKERGLPPDRYFNIITEKFYQSEAAGDVFIIMGDEAFKNKNYKIAEKYYNQYLSLKWRKDAGSVFLYKMICLYNMERYRNLIQSINNKKNLPPLDNYTEKHISLWLGRSYYKLNEYEECYNSMQKWRLRDYSEEDLLIICICSIKKTDLARAKDASELLRKNMDLYIQSLFMLGKYYVQSEDYESAKTYYNRIISESPSSEMKDSARIEMADIYIKIEKYPEAIQEAESCSNMKHHIRKNSILIIAFFKTGKSKEAASLTDLNLNQILKNSYGESVIKENLMYYYDQKDIKSFTKYAGYLKRYSSYETLLYYLSGKLFFELDDYENSFFNFYKLLNLDSNYKEEALYYISIITLLHRNNPKRAYLYLKKLSANDSYENRFSIMGKIDLSILSAEYGDVELSRKVLLDVIAHHKNILLLIQAENLFEYYGYAR